MSRLCCLFGITRQAYYQHWERTSEIHIEQALVLQEVMRLRRFHPRMGGRKLQVLLEPFLIEHQIKMGRDALFNLLSAQGLLVRRRKRQMRTTQSSHWLRKYSNLIRGLMLTGSNQLWVSDITYWKIGSGYVYISLITDAYSRRVMGYQVAENLEATATIQALAMALANLPPILTQPLIHHSDRGVQYCSKDYVSLLQKHKIQISMTESGDPLENAIAERVNGILKQEYLYECPVANLQEAQQRIKQVIEYYNKDRPHMSCGYLTPEQVHLNKYFIKTKPLF